MHQSIWRIYKNFDGLLWGRGRVLGWEIFKRKKFDEVKRVSFNSSHSNTSFKFEDEIFRNWTKNILRRFPLNVRAVSAKIKLPKIYLQRCHILRTDKKNLSLLLLPSWPRERKLDLKLSIFQLQRRFMSVQNKMAPVFSTLLRDLKLIFLRMLENFIAGSLGQVN